MHVLQMLKYFISLLKLNWKTCNSFVENSHATNTCFK